MVHEVCSTAQAASSLGTEHKMKRSKHRTDNTVNAVWNLENGLSSNEVRRREGGRGGMVNAA